MEAVSIKTEVGDLVTVGEKMHNSLVKITISYFDRVQSAYINESEACQFISALKEQFGI